MTKRPNGKAEPYYIEERKLWQTFVELPPGPGGKRRRKGITGRTATEVKKRVKELRKEMGAGVAPTTQFRTVKQFLDWWESEVLPGSVDQSSEDTYSNALRLWVVPYVGRHELVHLKPLHVTHMLRELEKAGYSKSTRSMARRVLGRALRRAEQEGWIARNPAHLADGPRMDENEEDIDGDDDSPIFTIEQAQEFLEAAKGHRYEGPMVVQLTMGLRRGEALGLSQANVFVDEMPQVIRVRQQVIRLKGKGLVVRKVKTKKSRRTLVLPPQVRAVIDASIDRQEEWRQREGKTFELTHGPLVFTTPIGSPIDPDNYRHQVAKLSKSVGIGHVGTHTLRKSAGSFLYALGVPMKTISEMLGHSSVRVTEELYVHLLENAKVASAEMLEKLFWSTSDSNRD